MPAYALKVMPGDWTLDMPLPFSAAQYEQVRNQVEAGTRVVLYAASPVDGIVGEGQVSGVFIRVQDWPATTLGALQALNPQPDYLLPIEVLYRRAGPEAVMPRAQVMEILDDPHFPRPGQDWLVLDDDVYHELIRGWT
jgi:hypothetical protein